MLFLCIFWHFFAYFYYIFKTTIFTYLTRGEFCDNPACSTGSLAIIPAVVAFGNGLLNHFFRNKLLEDKEQEAKI